MSDAPSDGSAASQNTTQIPDYSRGLAGVNVPLDVLITRILCVTIGAVCVIILLARLTQLGHAYLRRILSTSADVRQQRFWGTEESSLWANVKKHFLYAPLGRKRHNREIKLSGAVNVGTIPSRFHALLLSLYISSNIAYCVLLNYRTDSKAALMAELRGRSGSLALLNMIPLFILAGRNNPLISILRVSFDTYNLIHRWMGRIVALESLLHTIAWLVNAIDADGWPKASADLRSLPFLYWGLIATVSVVFMVLASPSPIRHAFYETFLHLHQLGAFLVVLGIYVHLDVDKLTVLPWIQLVVAIWVIERSLRLARLIHLNFSRRNGTTRVIVKALPGEGSRVTFYLPKQVRIAAGSHVYIYLPRISLWMSHPFSVAWTEPDASSIGQSSATSLSHKNSVSSTKKGATLDMLEKGQAVHVEDHYYYSQNTRVTLLVAAHTGMTRKLYNAALVSPERTLHLTGFIEGPYQSYSPAAFDTYDTAVLFCGGAGITHHLMFVRELLTRAAAGTIATRRIYLIWSLRTMDRLTWVRSFMDSILRLPNRREILITKLFISKPRSGREVSSPSETLQMLPGRCRPDVVLDEVLEERVGSVVVSVCGPGGFADEVRSAARKRIGTGRMIDFVEEAFTW